MNDKLTLLAKDLNKEFPASPRETLGGFVLGMRMLDKCRAELAGTAGEYHFNCPLDKMFLDFAGINAEEFKELVAIGATNEEVGKWISEKTTKSKQEMIQWNNDMRAKRIADLPIELQEYMEDYIPKFIPKNRPVYVFFDVYDLEEQRI